MFSLVLRPPSTDRLSPLGPDLCCDTRGLLLLFIHPQGKAAPTTGSPAAFDGTVCGDAELSFTKIPTNKTLSQTLLFHEELPVKTRFVFLFCS